MKERNLYRNGHSMDLQKFRQFLVVAEHLNLSHAAESLGVSQPALSKVMTRLQEELGIQLYVRKGRGIALTDAGATLRLRAEDIVERLEETIAHIADMRAGITGHVRLGAGPSFLTRTLPDALRMLETTQPNVRYTIREGTTEELCAWIKSREIDWALLGWVETDNEDKSFDSALNRTRLLTDELVVVTRSDHPLQKKPPTSFAELTAYNWVFPRTSTKLHRELNRRFQLAGLVPPVASVMTSSLVATFAILRRTNLMAVIARSSMSQQDMPGITALKQPWLMLKREAFLVTLRGMQLSPSATALVEKTRLLLNAPYGQ